MANERLSSATTAIGGCTAGTDHDRDVPEVDLLSPLTIRGVTLRNRIVMSPMCQYSAVDGMPDDWHLVHLGSRAAGGVGLVIVEATAIAPDGRISPGDLGIWSDAHADAFRRIAVFVKSQGAVPGIQLAHAGRKASCDVPWRGGQQLGLDQGGWETLAPSAVPFQEGERSPRALDGRALDAVVDAFEAAARRALAAGFEVIEIHAAHGYLLHQFLSPLANRRTDDYGGSLENRMRLALRVTERLRSVVPAELPLLIRVSATDWVEGGWDAAQSVELARRVKALGVDLVDTSSGGMTPTAQIPVGKGYQVSLARRIRDEAKIATGAVGLITDVQQANDIITGGDADLVIIGRELLRDPYWAIKAAQALEGEPAWPLQYGYAVRRRAR